MSIIQVAERAYGRMKGSRMLYSIARPLIHGGVRAYGAARGFRMLPREPADYRLLIDRYESGTTAVAKGLLRPGMVALDVGAHVGYYTRLFARQVGSSGHVYAFEPNPTVLNLLHHNTKRFPNVEVFDVAVMDRASTVKLYQAAISNTSSMWAKAPMGLAGAVAVRADSLDALLPDVSIDLAKIDAEGAELEVLRGMKRLVSDSPLLSMIVECSPRTLKLRGSDAATLLGSIWDLGFETLWIDEATGDVAPVRRAEDVRVMTERFAPYGNLLCVR